MKSIKAEFFLFLVTFIWGGTFVFTKIGLGFCSPSLYIIIRFCIALLLSIAFFRKHLRKISKRTIRNGLILGLLFGGGFLLQTYGLGLTSVSKSAFITGITVPITPIVYFVLFRGKVSKYSIIGVAVATLGLWLFANPDFDNVNIGDALTLASTIFWALYITLMDVFTNACKEKRETSQLVVLQFVAATPPAILFFFLVDYGNFYFTFDYRLLISLAFNGILASFMVTFIHTSIQRYTTPVKAALIFSLEPIIASSVAYIVFSEVLSTRELIGASILFSAVLISEIGGFFESRLARGNV